MRKILLHHIFLTKKKSFTLDIFLQKIWENKKVTLFLTTRYWPLKKNFPWKFSQKSLKYVHFLIYLYIDLNDPSILKFWFQFHIPGKISNHLIGHTIYFHVKIEFLYFRPPLHFCNGDIENENFIFTWKYIVWPIKQLEILPGIWILNQNFKIDRSLRSIQKYIRKWTHFSDFCENFQGKFFFKGQYRFVTIKCTYLY